jgi:hypothetical protein
MDAPLESMINMLIAQAQRDEELIKKMGEAVRREDKERVFVLACQLTGNSKKEQTSFGSG